MKNKKSKLNTSTTDTTLGLSVTTSTQTRRTAHDIGVSAFRGKGETFDLSELANVWPQESDPSMERFLNGESYPQLFNIPWTKTIYSKEEFLALVRKHFPEDLRAIQKTMENLWSGFTITVNVEN